jgi:hypothetical protein
MNLRATTLKPHHDQTATTQMRFILAAPPIGSSEVWTDLSEPQQQLVATTISKICQMLAHHPAPDPESEGRSYERID